MRDVRKARIGILNDYQVKRGEDNQLLRAGKVGSKVWTTGNASDLPQYVLCALVLYGMEFQWKMPRFPEMGEVCP